MRENIRQLAKDSFVYGVGDAFAMLISFVLIPVYTRYLTTYEYGTIEMMGTIIMLIGILCNFGLLSSQSYFFFSIKNDKLEQKKLVTSILQLRLIISVIVMCFAIFLSSKLNIYFFDGKLSKGFFLIAFIGFFCFIFQSQFIEILRYTHQTIKYIAIRASRNVLLATVAIVLIIFFKMGVLGYYTGYCVSAVVALFLAWRSIKRYLNWSQLHTKWWPKLLKFGLPLVPSTLGVVIINITDRWCIKYFMGLEYVGIYSLGYRCAFILFFYSTVFRTAWWPIAMKNIDNKKLFIFVSRIFLGLGLSLAILVSLCAPLIKVIVPVAYYGSYKVIGILSISFIFYGFLQITQLGTIMSENRGALSLIVLICAILNILLNFIFIPIWGIVGASIATMLAMLSRNIMAVIVSEKRHSFGLPLSIFIFQFLLGCCAVTLLLIMDYRILSILLSVLLFLFLIFVSIPIVYLKKYNYNIFKLLKSESTI